MNSKFLMIAVLVAGSSVNAVVDTKARLFDFGSFSDWQAKVKNVFTTPAVEQPVVTGKVAAMKKVLLDNPRTSAAIAAVCVVAATVAVYNYVQAKNAEKEALRAQLEEEEIEFA